MEYKYRQPKPKREEKSDDGIRYRTKSDKPYELEDWQKQLKIISNNFDKFNAQDHKFFENEFAKIKEK